MFIAPEIVGQNLISNQSFEDTTFCPYQPGQIDVAIGWTSFSDSPDYYHVCASTPGCFIPIPFCIGVPMNQGGFQYPFQGNAYAGFTTYSTWGFYREIIGVHLVQPLQIGKTYFVSAYFSCGSGLDMHGHTNNIGFKFFNQSYSSNNRCAIDNTADVYETLIITDTTNWVKISGTFIADSAYEYLGIGNFFDDLHTDTMNMYELPSHTSEAYYYIDNVCVTADSLNCNTITGIDSYLNENNFKIWPNPFKNTLNASLEGLNANEFELYDIYGRCILKETFTKEILFDTEKLETGLYFYIISESGKLLKCGKLVKED